MGGLKSDLAANWRIPPISGTPICNDFAASALARSGGQQREYFTSTPLN
jgi:hypothetical protein